MGKRAQAVPTVQIDNERVIVTEWRFAPGAETGWHTHGHDYVVVPTTKVAQLLGMSDVGLGKWCKAYGVPKPKIGYWAKEAVDQRDSVKLAEQGDSLPGQGEPDRKGFQVPYDWDEDDEDDEDDQ